MTDKRRSTKMSTLEKLHSLSIRLSHVLVLPCSFYSLPAHFLHLLMQTHREHLR